MTPEQISNKWTMKRFKTGENPEGHSDFEFFQLLAEDIKNHAIEFGTYIDVPGESSVYLYNQFIEKQK